MKDIITALIHQLQQTEPTLQHKKVVTGFDGFIDAIVRVIKTKNDAQQPDYFSSTAELGNYITEKSGSSFGLELAPLQEKIGGNMPITSLALQKLGVNVTCIGALGYPAINPLFKELTTQCECYSLAEPGTATALEFDDGKIILSQMKQLNELNWDFIKTTIGIDKLISIYNESDAYAILNWSEIAAATNIWHGLVKDVLPHCSKKNNMAFFDLCDCSQRSSKDIKEMLSLLDAFSKHCKVILSLNKNESRRIYEVLFNEAYNGYLEDIGTHIQKALQLEILILHTAAFSIGFTKDNNYKADTFFIEQPILLTGAGDNFNAGFITASLLDLSLHHRLVFANAVASLYMRNGNSTQIQQVINFLTEQINYTNGDTYL